MVLPQMKIWDLKVDGGGGEIFAFNWDCGGLD